MLADSGARYSVVPAAVLARLGIRPERTETFTLADGTSIRRRLGIARFELGGRRAASTVIFGKAGDSALLGVVTLEELGLMIDPLRRRLRPLHPRLGALAVS
jgi:predicted aspartyl protease